MIDFDCIDNNTLLIVPSSYKKNILLEMSSKKVLKSINVIDINEFIRKYLFDYDSKTLYYVMNKYNVKVDIALVYIKNLYYINLDEYDSDKLIFLRDLKQELLDEGLIYINYLFREKLKNRHIVVYGNMNKFQMKIIDLLKEYTDVTYVSDVSKNSYNHVIYECSTIEEEITFVCEKICSLIDDGIVLNKILLANLCDDYKAKINRIFNIFNLPIDIISSNLYATLMGKYFIDNLASDITVTLESIKLNFDLENEKLNYQYNKILEICNKYNWCCDYRSIKELLIYELKNISSCIDDFDKIRFIDIENYTPGDDDYVFLLGFSQGMFPYTEKDEEFLNDDLKLLLGLENTSSKNIRHKEDAVKFIKSTKNLVITYSVFSDIPLEISSINELLQYPVEKASVSYKYSNLNNNLFLSKFLDTYMKYGVKEKDLNFLMGIYPNNKYRSYDNNFSMISSNDLKDYKGGKLTLSYSSIDSYFHCAFRFYVSNILKLDIYDDNFMNYIGSLFHYVLQQYYSDNFSFEDSFTNFLKDNERGFTKKELFFLNKLKEELYFIIDVLNEQKKYITLNNVLLEERISINKSINDWNLNFVGIVDKIFYNDQKIVSVVDYKTGNPSIDLTNVPYGLGMQLPIYLYLIANKWKDAQIAGFYLQKIIPSVISKDYRKTYIEQRKDYLKLQGYSISNENLLAKFDNTYFDSRLIKGMKMTSNGFSTYSKLLNEDEINNLIKLVDKKIDSAIKNIVSADFDINPKQLDNELIGCEFCKFKDICFMNNKNIVNLNKYKDLDFLRGDVNA